MAKNELIIDLTQPKTHLIFVKDGKSLYGISVSPENIKDAIEDWVKENIEWAKFFEGTPI